MLSKKQIGLKIKEARSIKSKEIGFKYTGQNLADELKISRSFLGDIESGRKSAPEYILENIKKICNLDFNYFEDTIIDNPPKDINNECDNYAIKSDYSFTTAKEAMKFILSQPVIMGYGGFDIKQMSSDELIEFANDLLHQLKLLSFKYKK